MGVKSKKHYGHYQVKSELGRGGMAVVYKCWEPDLNRFVALKVLAEHLVHDKELKERFLREAKSMAAINHPNVIQVHFIGEDHGQPYFAMELVQGKSLAEILKPRTKLSIEHAKNIVYQACGGLLAAHSKGLIHRDIKPGNLMISDDGLLKLVDFGIAQSHKFKKRLTNTGELVGTPGYLSPEACIGQEIDIRADIFSLGIVFYQMLAGEVPFDNDSPLGLLLEVVEANILDIRKINKTVDNETSKILQKMIKRVPDERFQSCQEILDLLKGPFVNSAIETIISARTKVYYKYSKPSNNNNLTLANNLMRSEENEKNTKTTYNKLKLFAIFLFFSLTAFSVIYFIKQERINTLSLEKSFPLKDNVVETKDKAPDTIKETPIQRKPDMVKEDIEKPGIKKLDIEKRDKEESVENVKDGEINEKIVKDIIFKETKNPEVVETTDIPVIAITNLKQSTQKKLAMFKITRCVDVDTFTIANNDPNSRPQKRAAKIPYKLLKSLHQATIDKISSDNNSMIAFKSDRNICRNNKKSLVLQVEIIDYRKANTITKYLSKVGIGEDKLFAKLTLLTKKTRKKLASINIGSENIADILVSQNTTIEAYFAKKTNRFIRSTVGL